MRRYQTFLLLCISTAAAAFAGDGDVLSQVEALLNPQARYSLRELQSDGSFGLRALGGHYRTSNGVQTFAIDGLAEGYRLVIDLSPDGHAKPRLTEANDTGGAIGSPLEVSLNDGKFDRTDQTLDGRVKAAGGLPQTVVFGVYWDVSPTGLGPDTVEYTLAFRSGPEGPISVVHSQHDLRGTPLEAPRQAAADFAVGAIVTHATSLLLSVHSLGGATAEERTRLLPRLQPSIDVAIVEISKLTSYTHVANPIVVRQATSALARTNKVAAALQQLRDRELAESYLSSSDQARIESALKSWVAEGIPLTRGTQL